MKYIDIRSDTVTRPTKEMMAAMMAAPIGDDVYGEDPSINALESYSAELFGKEAALFCPSGTMCNQIAIRISTQPQDQVICDHKAHVYLYEGGGIASNSMVSVRLLEGEFGRLSAKQVEEAINPDNIHFPVSSLVTLENTSNKGGGSCYELAEIQAIRKVCDAHGLRLHLDGARVFNACVAKTHTPKQFGELFDTISFCLSKGLGAPVGSVLVGSNKDIKQALRVRKVMGGGMRQAGILAAAGLYALRHHVDRLEEDHQRARTLFSAIRQLSWVEDVFPIETNIVAFKPDPQLFSVESCLQRLKSEGVLGTNFGGGYVRFVTHLDVGDGDIEQLTTCLKKLA
ncbi:MAG: GntG family PLP-dependent aldolase [Bacteroidota bacterium]